MEDLVRKFKYIKSNFYHNFSFKENELVNNKIDGKKSFLVYERDNKKYFVKKCLCNKYSINEIIFYSHLQKCEEKDFFINFHGFDMDCDENEFIVLILVFDYIKGGDLTKYDQKFDISDIKFYFNQLLKIVQILQKYKIIHGDIKPKNILLDENLKKIYLIDFEGANFTDEKNKIYCNTPNYSSYETLNKNIQLNSDLWSCGFILLFLLTNQTLSLISKKLRTCSDIEFFLKHFEINRLLDNKKIRDLKNKYPENSDWIFKNFRNLLQNNPEKRKLEII